MNLEWEERWLLQLHFGSNLDLEVGKPDLKRLQLTRRKPICLQGGVMNCCLAGGDVNKILL